MNSVVGCEVSMNDIFTGTINPTYAALVVLYHHRITHALLEYSTSPHRDSSLYQRRFHVGLYYEVVSCHIDVRYWKLNTT